MHRLGRSAATPGSKIVAVRRTIRDAGTMVSTANDYIVSFGSTGNIHRDHTGKILHIIARSSDVPHQLVSS